MLKYSNLSIKRRVSNNRMVWKTYLNLINEGSTTNREPGIFLTLYNGNYMGVIMSEVLY